MKDNASTIDNIEEVEKALSDVIRYCDDKDLTLGAELGLQALSAIQDNIDPSNDAKMVAMKCYGVLSTSGQATETIKEAASLVEAYAFNKAHSHLEFMRENVKVLRIALENSEKLIAASFGIIKQCVNNSVDMDRLYKIYQDSVKECIDFIEQNPSAHAEEAPR